MWLFTDKEAISTLAPGSGCGNRHMENKDEMTKVSVWIRVEHNYSVDTMVTSQVTKWSVRKHGMQVASATVAG